MALLAACAAPLPPPVREAELANAADGTRVVLARGGEVKILLDVVPKTGMQWHMPANVAPVLSPIGQPIYVGKSAEVRNVGAGAMNIFRFRAEQPGRVDLEFAYRRPWESELAPAQVRHYEVIVQ
jgi:inhibitor of cysteine peptidase